MAFSLIRLMITQIAAITPNATEMLSNVNAILGALLPTDSIDAISNEINTVKAVTPITPLAISSQVILDMSLTTPAITAITTAMPINTPVILGKSFPASCVIPTIAKRNTAKPPIAIAPFIISSYDSMFINLTTPTINTIAIASLIIIPPILLTLLPANIDTIVSA